LIKSSAITERTTFYNPISVSLKEIDVIKKYVGSSKQEFLETTNKITTTQEIQQSSIILHASETERKTPMDKTTILSTKITHITLGTFSKIITTEKLTNGFKSTTQMFATPSESNNRKLTLGSESNTDEPNTIEAFKQTVDESLMNRSNQLINLETENVVNSADTSHVGSKQVTETMMPSMSSTSITQSTIVTILETTDMLHTISQQTSQNKLNSAEILNLLSQRESNLVDGYTTQINTQVTSYVKDHVETSAAAKFNEIINPSTENIEENNIETIFETTIQTSHDQQSDTQIEDTAVLNSMSTTQENSTPATIYQPLVYSNVILLSYL